MFEFLLVLVCCVCCGRIGLCVHNFGCQFVDLVGWL